MDVFEALKMIGVLNTKDETPFMKSFNANREEDQWLDVLQDCLDKWHNEDLDRSAKNVLKILICDSAFKLVMSE